MEPYLSLPNRRRVPTSQEQPSRAFSLLEMMFVVALILILASIALPSYQTMLRRTREAGLRDDLYTMRSMINRFTLDNKRPPASLQELVDSRYLGAIPYDPITHSTETWQVETGDFELTSTESVVGVVDVHSGSDETSLEGTSYSNW